MRCEFDASPATAFPGTTLFTKSSAECICQTAVYVPAAHAAEAVKLNVVPWVHG